MKQELRQIYDDLSKGKLSQKEALGKIKAIKLQEQDKKTGVLLASPVWQEKSREASAAVSHVQYTEHHIILCELSQVDARSVQALLPHSQCLSLQAGEQKTIAQRYTDHALACFERIKAILQDKPQGRVLIQLVVADHQEQALHAGLSALLKTAAQENPQLIGQLILAVPEITTEELAQLLREEKTSELEPLVKYEQARRKVLAWHEAAAGHKKPPVAFKDQGVYLITGGLGGLGLIFAKEILAQTHHARIVLTGRSALTAANQSRLDALLAPLGLLSYRQVDLNHLEQVQQLIARVQEEYGQLNGILHGAGMIADNFILKKSSEEFSQVLAPKITGAYNLDQASKHVELDFFVLFSSTAGALGNIGQADYATANSFMDQFAAYRNLQVAAHQRHGRTRTINWPLWQDGGMDVAPATLEALRQTMGTHLMQTATGLETFYRSLALPHGQLLVAEGDLPQMRRVFVSGQRRQPELSQVVTKVEQPVTPEKVAAHADSDGLAEKTQGYLRRQFSELLKLPPQTIDPEAIFEKYGMDSILAMQLTGQLEKTFGPLSKTLFFEYQTIGELSQYFLQSHSARLAALFAPTSNGHHPTPSAAAQPETRPSVPTRLSAGKRFSRQRNSAPTPAKESEPIAIIGLSGRYPEAVNIEAYWSNLRAGKDCIVEVPKERWDWKEYFTEDRSQSGHHFSKWGGFIAGVDEFDPLFFNIPPREAKHIDPQERLFLQHAWMAVEDAGYTRASLQVPSEHDLPGQVGVYVGLMYSEYQLFGAEAGVRGKRMGIAGSFASIANRVSYALNLHGPSMTLDTMCSSSLTAIHVACQDLKLGRTTLAIAGGVNVSIHPGKYLMLSAGQFISSDGHCQSFGEGGDGYIPGEGVGVVVLKRLSDAQRDGDHIYGIIRGSALNHGGKTNGYTVPNPQAQSSAISRALAEAHVDPRHISYIEAHGTGTKLGDPIEIAALNKVFQQTTQETGFCLIGSAKSNIGHCESAAGIAGLTKVLLQMQHEEIVPSLHSSVLNPHIDFGKTAFVVNQELQRWEQPEVEGKKVPRIAGISSFGAGGSNAHMIVEEYQSPVAEPIVAEKVAVLLSARTAEQLQEKAKDLLEFVRRQSRGIDLAAMAYTLQVGREAMEERLGLVVGRVEELEEKLQAYLAGAQGMEGAYQGQVKRNKEALSLFSTDADLQQAVDKWMAGKKLSKLVELWVKGLEVAWSKLYGEAQPRRISLPTYPFAREHYWIEMPAVNESSVKTATAVLHPLLHRNTSDLSEQRYTSTFTGQEFFFADHQVAVNGHGNQKVLPGVACLEMARAAIQQASPVRPESAVLELHNTVWAQPIVITGKKDANIALMAEGHEQIDFEIYSQESGREIVHCQGRAIWSPGPAPARLDIEQLKTHTRLDRQVLAHLTLPTNLAGKSEEYVLHPCLMDSALHACGELVAASSNQPRVLSTLELLRVISPCNQQMFAWVRYSAGSQASDEIVKLDIDLCDEQGNICAQMQGLNWKQVSTAIVDPISDQVSVPLPAAVGENISVAPVRKEIAFSAYQQAIPTHAAQEKRSGISLVSRGPRLIEESASVPKKTTRPKASITLSKSKLGIAVQKSTAPAVSSVRLFDDGQGVFSIQITAHASSQTPAKDIIAQLLQALDRVQQEASLKVLALNGIERCFSHGGREDYNEAVSQELYSAMVSFPYPLIAVLHADTRGAGFLGAALCDFMVCNEDVVFGYTDAEAGFYPTTAEVELLSERFGAALAEDLAYVTLAATGKELRRKGWTMPTVSGPQVEEHAERLARTLAEKSQEALRLLKQHLTRDLAGLVKDLARVDVAATETEGPADAAIPEITSSSVQIHLETPVANVLVAKFDQNAGALELVGDMEAIFTQVHQRPYYKAMVLASENADFLPETEPVAGEVVENFQRLLVESRIPVVAALDGNARGVAWLVGQLCDACVYSRTGSFSSFSLGANPQMSQTAAVLFVHRLGDSAGREVLLTGAEYSGVELERRAGALLATEQNQVLPAAIKVAGAWAQLPQATLAAWKQHTATILREKLSTLPAVNEGGQKVSLASPVVTAPAAIPLQSKVITAIAHPEGIVVVKMEDREAKNMFSPAFLDGLTEVFSHIEKTPEYKVVILTGYDNYFASGGTKENLLAVQSGKARFTDSKVFQAALDCKLPVITAMQGHGIGAGWVLGMLADIVLLSEESRYVSPYMNYGFTPGAGATWILGDRLGQDLARESLLTGQQYAGSELKSRGLNLAVLPRAEVPEAAMKLARQMAQVPRGCLLELKQQLTAGVHQRLEETYRLELAMHEKTFVGQAETLAQIQKNFHQEAEPSSAIAQPKPVETLKPSVNGHVAAVSRSSDSDVLSAVTAGLRTLLANELQMRESDIDENMQFVDLGLDSISGLTWIRKINEKYHITIEATKVYNYPTLGQLSRYVKEEAEKLGTLSRADAPAAAETPKVKSTVAQNSQQSTTTKLATETLTSRRNRRASRFADVPNVINVPATRAHQPIAVIGMAGQFPQARNLDEFWQNIAQGRNCITQVDRWDVKTYYQPGPPVSGKSNSQWFGALADYDRFDPLFFNISPTEAEYMDPQQRLFLQACWHSIEDAGYDARLLSGSKCGVFVGCVTGHYHQLSLQHQLSAQGFTGSALSILAARISYFLNLQGPCISIDTACSSSLVAMAHACDSLISGNSDLALAGGVYVMAGPQLHIMTSQAGMLSPDGKCCTFDQRADGFVPGEGVGVVLLKRLTDAERDHDTIYGVIKGWGVNQDGKTNGITAPNPESQTRLEQEVYDKYQIDPAKIQLIEAHGTATKLGDPIEVEGLKKAFAKYTQDTEYCALGSVKSNIGHCATAAGIAGAIKLLLALKHKQLPPTINFEQLNEHIELKGSPFYVNSRLQEWNVGEGQRRQSAISSFGFSGTNAHVVIGEYLPPIAIKPAMTVVTPNTKAIIPLSARTIVQLKQRACDLWDYIRKEGVRVNLTEVAYTLQVGREAMEERVGFLVSSVEELAGRLESYINGEAEIPGSYRGAVKRSKESLSLIGQDEEAREMLVGKWIASGKLSKLAEAWAKGLEVDWKKLYGAEKPKRISLPLYPFAKERYWIETGEAQAEPVSAEPAIKMADLNQQHEESTFAGEESFMGDHRVTTNGHGDLRDESTNGAQGKAASVLLATPLWQSSNVELSAGAGKFEYAEHHVILCELAGVDAEKLRSLLPHSQCLPLQAAQEKTIAQRFNEHALACFERIQAILRGRPQGKVLVHIVASSQQEQALLAGLSALLRTAAMENPQFIGQFILAMPEITTEELAQRLQDEKTGSLDPLIKYESNGRHALGWQEVATDKNKPPVAFKEHGVYLITGGLGTLGLLFAKEIFAQARHAQVILTGRSAVSVEKQACLDALSTSDGRLSYRQVDLEALDQVQQFIAAIHGERGHLDGILHCAGMIADNFILKKSSEEFSQVLAPKVFGTCNLDQASRNLPLDFFVLFSSTAGAIGNLGQADYATGNGFMDQFAVYRNLQVAAGQRHGRTRSINWPLWEAGGMAIDPSTLELLQQITGTQPMQTSTGLRAFYRSLALPCDQMLVVEGTQPKITTYLQKSRLFRPPFNTETASSGQINRGAAINLDQLQQQLKSILAKVLRIEASMIDVDQPFSEFGLDSFLGAEMIVAVNKTYGTELSNLKPFDYPTVREFALFLEKEIRKLPGYSPQQPAAQAVKSPVPSTSSDPVLQKRVRAPHAPTSNPEHADGRIAIIGMSGRYPQAPNLKQYWENLAEGRNSIVEVPRSRWDVNRYYDPDRSRKNKTYSKWLGAMDDIDCFDPLFFRISPQEAECMDPQHRLFMQESYKAFEDAGYSSNALSNRKCGVYLGISTNEYAWLLLKNGVHAPPVTSNSYAIAAARIAYYLNLKGPAISVDTACSSSLVAIHLACQGLLNGEMDMALAGGVSLWLAPESYLTMSQAGMFSPDGQCKTFDDSANGIVNGEGVGALVLKRLKDAEQDNDFIYGVILGSGMNQDGRTNGITAPSVNSQIELERSIYAKHEIDPETISYVETHGTGTKLGDPIELEALATVFQERTNRKNFCALGSVKSNIGHTTSAAGVAGVQKVLLSLQHRTLVPTLNVRKENSHFDFKSSPFYISRTKHPWDGVPGSPRRAAVSSFGFSGTNAHLVIEEYVPPTEQAVSPDGNSNFIVPLSARTPEQLRQKAQDLLEVIHTARQYDQPDLASVAYTLQTGREAMEERLGFVVNSVDQLAEKLNAYLNGEKNTVDVYQGRVDPGNEGVTVIGQDDDMQEAVAKWIVRKKFSKLLFLWIRGLNFDWNRLYGDAKPRRISLPTYPFAKERYWIDAAPVSQSLESRFEVNGSMKSIEDIINEIDDDTMETEQAVEALKMLV